MHDVVIRVDNLGKRYRLGVRAPSHSLRESLTNLVAAPFRRLIGRNNQGPSKAAPQTIWALREVSFEVTRGEIVGIVGRNGAGKSTLLKILSRITEPTEGSAEIYGRVGSLLEVGTGFHGELTGRENIFLNGAILGMKKSEIARKLDEIVAFAEVGRFLDTPVKRYSSGMHLRLAFAVAAHLDPEILVVDEVLAVGDAEFQGKCLGKMEEVTKEGRTVLLVSHNLMSLKNLCTKGIWLQAGRIMAEGSIADVISGYVDSGKEHTGEVTWPSPDVAPGNQRVRLKAVRVVSERRVTGDVDIAKEIAIEVDYWNLENDARRLVSIHLYNSMGICVLSSGNTTSACLVPDPWFTRRYPCGLFRTVCTIPGTFLNDGLHWVTVIINEKTGYDNILFVKDVLSFVVQDTGGMRKEYTGPWIGVVRPRLHWHTTQLS